jgi:superfamily II DNA or RNA helicase
MTGVMRAWQAECVEKAVEHYESFPHFFCQATPGAGKTWMAGEVARQLIVANKVDLVLCFAPSCQVVEGLRATFARILHRRMDGFVGAIGDVSTYQGMEFRGDSFWELFDYFRVFAVFDEIHHCAGQDPLLSNAWGQTIVQKIQDRAAYTLALSGTPWRSDDKTIALARYSSPEGRLICDYRYGLREAISDKVCRSPRITVVDNLCLKLTEQCEEGVQVSMYQDIAHLLSSSPVSFEDLLHQDEILEQVIELGCQKLDNVRLLNPSAGGLIVATNTNHAQQIASKLISRGESCSVVTTKTPGAQQLINEFRVGQGRWIVAVGMISEGTDIPRLQVCCYLSRIRTELHYRQVLGRILRRTGVLDDQAWLYVLAEPTLVEYSRRVADDLPEDVAVLHINSSSFTSDANQAEQQFQSFESGDSDAFSLTTPTRDLEEELLNDSYWQKNGSFEIDVSTHFRTELLSIW